MIDEPMLAFLGGATGQLLRGVVAGMYDDVRVAVRLLDEDDEVILPADILTTSEAPVHLRIGDTVLCWADGFPPERGVLLGRIGGPTTLPPLGHTAPTEDGLTVPEALVLEAKHSLSLRVGESSITIREDGKILIKGKDLVSHAQRMNRIKGGAVSIN